MDNIFSVFKLLVPMLLTPIINRFVSTFRIRQLYLSFDEILPCILPEAVGFVVCVRIYNKGKDKENKVEVIFPSSSFCQILASDYPGVSIDNNKLLVDRVLPKQVVVLSVYIKSSVGMSSPGKPFIKSEDANGKSYSDRSRVPPSLGPSVMFLSFFFAMFITFLYVVSSGASILYPYYSLRYSSLLSHGFTPASFSDNYLISKAGFKSKSPITVNKPYAEGGRIVLPLVIKNITSSKIRLTIVHNLNSEDYKRDKEKANAGLLNLRESVLARNSIDEKYGYSSKDELFFQNLILEPGEEKNIMIRHTVLPTTTLKNFNFFVDIKSGDYDYDGFRDNYDFDVEKFNGLSVVQELLRSLQR